jgi:hypothetical protein
MYTVAFLLLDNKTLATLLFAEFGFLGDILETQIQSPFFCGEPIKAFVLFFFIFLTRKVTMGFTQFFNTAFFLITRIP